MNTVRNNKRQDAIIAEAYNKLYASVTGYITRRIGDACIADAEDLCQDTFIQLLEYDKYIEPENISKLVYTIARNHVIDYLRHHVRTRAAQEYFSWSMPQSARTTEEQIDVNELERLESQCIAKMPERKAQIYVLYIHQRKSIDEIASSLDISPRTVENQIFRARADFRSVLAMC